MLDVGRLIDTAVESGVDLKHRSARMRLTPCSMLAAGQRLKGSVINAKVVHDSPLH